MTEDIIQPQPIEGTFRPEQTKDNFIMSEHKAQALAPDGPLSQLFGQIKSTTLAKSRKQVSEQSQGRAEQLKNSTFESAAQAENLSGVSEEFKELPSKPEPEPKSESKPELKIMPEEFQGEEYQVDPVQPEPGLIHTTSPIEFGVSGGASVAKIAGKAGLKLFAATYPAEQLGIVYGEELGEEHPIWGLLLEVGVGVGTGIAAEKLMGKAAAELSTKVAPKMQLDETNVAAQKRRTNARRMLNKVKNRDLTDPQLRSAVRDVIEYQYASIDNLKPKQRQQLEETRQAVEEADKAQVTPKKTTRAQKTAFMKHPEAIQKAVSKQVHEEWYGAPLYGRADSLKSAKAYLVEQSEAKGKKLYGQELNERAKALVEKSKKSMVDSTYKRLVVGRGMEEGPETLKKAEKEVAKRVALGLAGQQYQGDLAAAMSKALQDTGVPANKNTKEYWDLLDTVEQQLAKEYREGVKADIDIRLEQVNQDDFFGKTDSFVLGGTRDTDAKFVTPDMPGVGITYSRYEGLDFSDWSITDFLQFNEDKGRLVFSGEAPKPPAQDTPSTVKSKLFNFADINSLGQAKQAIEKTLSDVASLKKEPVKGSKFKDIPEAFNLKVKSQYTNKDGKVVEHYVLPENTVDNVARMLGWQEDMLATQTIKTPAGKLQQNLPEDLWNNYNLKREWDVAFPDYFANSWKKIQNNKKLERQIQKLGDEQKAKGDPDGKLQSQKDDLEKQIEAVKESIDPRHYILSGAESEYKAQRNAFIQKKLGVNLEVPEQKRKFYNQLDQLAILYNRFTNDINSLGGSPERGQAIKMFTLLQDRLGGTNKFETLSKLDRKAVREMARKESELFGKNMDYDPKQSYERLAKLADEQGIPRDQFFEDYKNIAQGGIFGKSHGEFEQGIEKLLDENPSLSREQAEEDYFSMLHDAEIRADMDKKAADEWAVDSGERGSDTGYWKSEESVYDNYAEAADQDKTVRLKHEPRTSTVAKGESFAISNAFAEVEDRMGSRLTDTLYKPSILPDGEGRVNVLRVNSIDDINDVIKAFDSPINEQEFGIKGTVADTLLDDIDTEIQLGIPAHKGHSQDTINRLATVASDVQDQIDEAAEILIRDPDTALNAITFDKLKAIQGAVLQNLTNGRPTEEAIKQLAKFDFRGLSSKDSDIIDSIAESVRNNYIVREQGKDVLVDTARAVEQAKMLRALDDSAARTKFLKDLSYLEDSVKYSDEIDNIQSLRAKANKIVEELCGE